MFTLQVVELDWWSVSRDCVMYAIAVVTLILTLLDDVIYWHEALLLVLMYTLYILGKLYAFADTVSTITFRQTSRLCFNELLTIYYMFIANDKLLQNNYNCKFIKNCKRFKRIPNSVCRFETILHHALFKPFTF